MSFPLLNHVKFRRSTGQLVPVPRSTIEAPQGSSDTQTLVSDFSPITVRPYHRRSRNSRCHRHEQQPVRIAALAGDLSRLRRASKTPDRERKHRIPLLLAGVTLIPKIPSRSMFDSAAAPKQRRSTD